jgi:uncharacterized damage-inducible protein DinB
MKVDEIRTLFEYNDWANRRVLDAAARVSAEQFVAPYPLSHGSLRGALVHAYGAERTWRLRFEGAFPAALPLEQDFPTLDSLQSSWAEEQRAMRAYLGRLSQADLDGMLHYRSSKGLPYENRLWNLLAHLVNHGTQTRAEAAVALSAYGASPGDLDMLLFFREQQESPG